MYEHFIDKFEWFLRADDDVFIKPDKLEKFLRRVDSTKAQFIGKLRFIASWDVFNNFWLFAPPEGQAGRGNNEEFGLLSLEFDENFCMGGPGIIMSRQTLKRGKDFEIEEEVLIDSQSSFEIGFQTQILNETKHWEVHWDGFCEQFLNINFSQDH